MKRRAGFDLSKALSDPEFRNTLTRAAGEKALDHIAKLGERAVQGVLQGYAASTASMPEPTPELADLALRNSFGRGEIEAIGEGRAWVLARAALVIIEKRRCLTLSQSARAAILDAAHANGSLQTVLDQYAAEDESYLTDPGSDLDALIGSHMRMLMRGTKLHPTNLPSVARRALVAAREALDKVTTLPETAPSLAECRRKSALAELLDPLGLMIGLADPLTAGQDGSSRPKDRFVGRRAALRTLRELVDVLDAESTGESLTRIGNRTMTTLKGYVATVRPQMMILSADGGMGKSTLIAKFVLQHAFSPQYRFPFAILDFDRAALQPRNPASLIAEIARQIALQFPDHQTALDEFRTGIERDLATGRVIDLARLCDRLWTTLTDILSAGPVNRILLTLDTFELVQCDTLAMTGVADMLRALAIVAGDQLCVVIAGRTGAADIVPHMENAFEVQKMRLDPFSLDEARELVARLGRQFMAGEWNDDWTDPIAGDRSDPPLRREPLTLRLAVELVRDAEPERRAALVREIAAHGSGAQASFLGTLYRHRILDHLKDDRARQLAWPGLVARTVTRTLAREVLAPLCDLTPDEAEIGFDRLGAQGWIVEHVGDALRHRRDLRARTLPLMRATDRDRFETVIRALINFYDTGPEADPVEADYYRLLLGGSDLLARDWQQANLTELANAADDFEPGSPARKLIALATATHPVSVDMLRGLPPVLVWRHAARACISLRTFDDERTDPRLLHMMDVPAPDTRHATAPSLANAWQHTQIKTGRWDGVDLDALQMPLTEIDTTLFAFYAARMTGAGLAAPEFWGDRHPELIQRLGAPRVGKNWRAAAESLSIARSYDPDLWNRIDRSLADAPPRGSHWARSAEIGLRAILINGRASRMAAFRPWCQMEAVRVRQGVSKAEAARFLDLRKTLELTRLCPALERAVRGRDRAPPLLADKEALQELSMGFEEMSDGSLPDMDAPFWTQVKDYVSVRSPEWIVPFAYLLTHARTQSGTATETKGGFFSMFSRQDNARTEDMVHYLTNADRVARLSQELHELIKQYALHDRLIVRVWHAGRHV